MKYRISRVANRELDGIWKYVAESSGSEDVATRFDDEFHAAIKELTRHPGFGHNRPDVPDKRYRFWSVSSYLIAYHINRNVLVVDRVIHGSRDIRKLFRN